MSPQITDDDVGKSVANADGDEVGMVADVQHGTAHVEPGSRNHRFDQGDARLGR